MTTPLIDALNVPAITAYELDDAAAGLRRLGLDDVADLVLRARREFLRFRPTGSEELSAADEELWDRLDEEFFAIAPSDRLEAAVAARLARIAPELASP